MARAAPRDGCGAARQLGAAASEHPAAPPSAPRLAGDARLAPRATGGRRGPGGAPELAGEAARGRVGLGVDLDRRGVAQPAGRTACLTPRATSSTAPTSRPVGSTAR